MVISVEMDGRIRSLLGGHLPRRLVLGLMTIYNKDGLKELLGVGTQTAYRILREYGFRIGYSERSPMRITDEQINKWISDKERGET